jgi:hypothetical protein
MSEPTFTEAAYVSGNFAITSLLSEAAERAKGATFRPGASLREMSDAALIGMLAARCITAKHEGFQEGKGAAYDIVVDARHDEETDLRAVRDRIGMLKYGDR